MLSVILGVKSDWITCRHWSIIACKDNFRNSGIYHLLIETTIYRNCSVTTQWMGIPEKKKTLFINSIKNRIWLWNHKDYTFAKMDAALEHRGHVVVDVWVLKPNSNASQWGDSTIFLFSWLLLRQTSHQHEWRNSSEEKWHAVMPGERCPSWATIQQMVLLSDYCILLFLSPLSLFCPHCDEEAVIFHLVIYI